MKPQATNIISMLSKPLVQRMIFEGGELQLFLQKVPFFRRYFPNQSQKIMKLCIQSTLLKLEANEDLYNSQELSDQIYLVIEGEMQVKPKHSNIIRKVCSYDLIGHVQSIFNLPERTEQITTLTCTYCMVIASQNFKRIWQNQQHQQIKKSFHYLTSNKYFQYLSNYDRYHLSLMMVKNCFKQGQTIIINGSINQNILYIIYGKLSVIKKLTIGGVEKQVILQSLQEMDSFGEFQTFNAIPNQVSVKAASIGTYYSIDIKQAIKMNHPFVELVKQYGRPYPTKKELQWRFEVQTKVEKCKDQVKKKLHLYT